MQITWAAIVRAVQFHRHAAGRHIPFNFASVHYKFSYAQYYVMGAEVGKRKKCDICYT